MSQTDKLALQRSQAGMRFIAQTSIYNQANWPRLAQFIRESYAPVLLEERNVAERLADFQAWQAQMGRMRVKQVLASNEHHVVVALEVEREANLYYLELQCEGDYPHLITRCWLAPLVPVESEDEDA
ncbi:MAG: hypothetical protein NZ750_02040 [Anaerolineae bacterium]|nr:hypothetical protein [Anaerolineae bacterium]MDW8173540.1 hypothetical protein [Anaerolineae bacterium]